MLTGFYRDNPHCFICGGEDADLREDMRNHPWCDSCKELFEKIQDQEGRDRYYGDGPIQDETMEDFL